MMLQVLLAFLLFLSFFSCTSDRPEPINLGKDLCEYCRMAIADKRFAAEVITKKGRVYKFDSIECMVAYYNENEEYIKKAYVTNFSNPEEFIEAEKAIYVRSQEIRSPMGMNLSAYKDMERAKSVKGEILDWKGLRELIKKEYKFSH